MDPNLKTYSLDQNLINELIEKLEKTAVKKTAEDRAFDIDNAEEFFNPCDAFGGNYDDAYYGGIETGGIESAREILVELKNLGIEKSK